jgi:aryl-alcohol dehydrogenase-like predicted oxidoreductase
MRAALGTADFGTSITEDEAFRLLDKFASLGGTMIDTANNYAFWHEHGTGGDSERVIGKWLKTVDRQKFYIMTKIGSMPVSLESRNCLEGLSAKAIEAAVDKSLERLGVEKVDMLLAHHDDHHTPLIETWMAFSEFVRNGRVGKIGISNYTPDRLRRLGEIIQENNLEPVSCVQMKHSLLLPVAGVDFGKLILLDKAFVLALRKYFPRSEIFGYSPLLGGIYENDSADLPSRYDSSENRQMVKNIRLEATRLNVAPSALVLKQIADEGIIPVTSTSKPERLEQNLALLARECS